MVGEKSGRGARQPAAMPIVPSMSDPRPQPHRRNFGEAVASWQLAVQTEVKKTSTLPTAMFDACDPMLEARLCEAADAMFQFLLTQQAPAHGGDDAAQLDLETVSLGELQAMMQQLATQPQDQAPLPQLDAGSDGEVLGILADCCCSADDTARAHAGRHLAQRFGVTADTDPLQLAAQLLQQLRAVVPQSRPDAADRLDRTCEQIAAAVLQVCMVPAREPGA